jgi:hypothetical protein
MARSSRTIGGESQERRESQERQEPQGRQEPEERQEPPGLQWLRAQQPHA